MECSQINQKNYTCALASVATILCLSPKLCNFYCTSVTALTFRYLEEQVGVFCTAEICLGRNRIDLDEEVDITLWAD